jgi:hypothetical protein
VTSPNYCISLESPNKVVEESAVPGGEMVTPDFKFNAPRSDKPDKPGHFFKSEVQKVTAMNQMAGKI